MRRNAPRLPWRKLLTNPPLSWQLLPVVTRGIGTEILRHLDNSLSLPIGTETPHVAVCRMLGAHVRERRTVKAAIDELIKRGLLVLEGDEEARCLKARIPDLEEYEDTTVARRQRDTDTTVARQCDDNGATLARQPNRLNSMESFNTTPGDKIREEKNREDSPVVPSWPASNLDRLVSVSSPEEQQRRDVFWKLANRYADCRGDGWQAWNGNRPQIVDVAAYVVSASEAEGVSADVIVDETLRGFFADTWARNASWPWKLLAKDPARYRGGTRGDLELDRAKAAYDRALAELTEAGESGRKDLDELIQRKCAASDAVRRIERERINRNHRAAQ